VAHSKKRLRLRLRLKVEVEVRLRFKIFPQNRIDTTVLYNIIFNNVCFFRVASSLKPAFTRALCEPVLSENTSAYILYNFEIPESVDVCKL